MGPHLELPVSTVNPSKPHHVPPTSLICQFYNLSTPYNYATMNSATLLRMQPLRAAAFRQPAFRQSVLRQARPFHNSRAMFRVKVGIRNSFVTFGANRCYRRRSKAVWGFMTTISRTKPTDMRFVQLTQSLRDLGPSRRSPRSCFLSALSLRTF